MDRILIILKKKMARELHLPLYSLDAGYQPICAALAYGLALRNHAHAIYSEF